MEKVEIKHYTVAQVRNWLDHNIKYEGLTSEVIRPAFAWALIHNPDVKVNDPIVAAIYDENKLAAATCAFPEIMVKPDFLDERGKPKRVWWFPMLWVKPEYRGKGYGLVVIGSLAEVYGMDCAWTAWAVPESIEVFEYIGCSTYYFPRYFMSEKNIKTSTIKGKLAYAKQEFVKWWKNSRKPRMPRYDYELRYLREFDDYTCDFIRKHEDKNFFQWSKETHNWHLVYPWNVSMPLTEMVSKTGEFFSEVVSMTLHYLVQVWHKGKLIGVYVLRQTSGKSMCISEDSIYYDNKYKEIVFASVVEHIRHLQVTHFDTEDEALAKFVQKYIYFPKCTTEQLSLSISPSIEMPSTFIR